MSTTATRSKKTTTRKTAATPAAELLGFARERAQTAKTWTELHNAIYGLGGKFGELFADQSARAAYAKSAEFRAIAELIGALRGHTDAADETMPSGKFVLRLPESLHAALLAEAKAEGVSLNQLCLAKLASQLKAVLR